VDLYDLAGTLSSAYYTHVNKQNPFPVSVPVYVWNPNDYASSFIIGVSTKNSLITKYKYLVQLYSKIVSATLASFDAFVASLSVGEIVASWNVLTISFVNT
jgi:hypothetical protein